MYGYLFRFAWWFLAYALTVYEILESQYICSSHLRGLVGNTQFLLQSLDGNGILHHFFHREIPEFDSVKHGVGPLPVYLNGKM